MEMLKHYAMPFTGITGRRSARAVRFGSVTDRVRGHWHNFRTWLMYRPEQNYMRRRSGR
jgi:hypothetical protein